MRVGRHAAVLHMGLSERLERFCLIQHRSGSVTETWVVVRLVWTDTLVSPGISRREYCRPWPVVAELTPNQGFWHCVLGF